MTGLDWIVLGIVILLALFGWAQGFVSGALALVGFAIGAWLGTRLGPLVLNDGADSGWAPAFGLIGALIAGAVLAMGFEGLGARLRARVRTPAAAALDGALGAALTACVGLGVVWVLGAVALGSGGELRQEVQRSYILQRLNTILPPTGGLLNALENLDPFPRIDGTGMNAHGRHFQCGSEMVRAAIVADEERRGGKQFWQLRQFAAAHK